MAGRNFDIQSDKPGAAHFAIGDKLAAARQEKAGTAPCGHACQPIAGIRIFGTLQD